MKKLLLFSSLACALVFGSADAANVTIYYSPSCPHCHHARDFIADHLVYEYQTISAELVNVTTSDDNFKSFEDALKKCEYTSGGIPVIVIGDKCWQGYGATMNDAIRNAVAVDLSDLEKSRAIKNRTAMDTDSTIFKSNNTKRANVITERGGGAFTKSSNKSTMYFYIFLAVLVLSLGFIFIRKNKK